MAGVSLGALGFLLLMGQPFALKVQEPRRQQYKIVKVINQFGHRSPSNEGVNSLAVHDRGP